MYDFFLSRKFFPTHKICDTGFYLLICESFLTKLQFANYDLFMLFETLNLHFRYFR